MKVAQGLNRGRIVCSCGLIALGFLVLLGCGNLLPMPNQGGGNAGGNAGQGVAGSPVTAPANTGGTPGTPVGGTPVAATPGTTPGAAVGQPATAAGAVPGAAAMYGDQAGETILGPDPQIPDALLVSRKEDTFYKLSNPRWGTSRFGRPTLQVDYEKTRVGSHGASTLIMHKGDGTRSTVSLIGGLYDTRDTIDIEIITFGFPGNAQQPSNIELYLVASDHRYGAKAPRFKVSNSAVMGTMPKLTPVRHWTADELKMLSSPPPNYTNPNAHPQVGLDTKLVGTEGGGVFRYVEPNGKLLGVDFRLGEWDKVKCLGGLTPVFTRDQPAAPATQRSIAREGYAVAAMNVKSKQFVNAIQIVYAKIGADGTLDMKDTYEGDWIGYPDVVESPPTKLGEEGRAVIGLINKQGAILNMVGLVLERR